MSDIALNCNFDDETVYIEITRPAGAGGNSFHVSINKYYNGRVMYSPVYGWSHDINPKSGLYTEDIRIIIEMIEERGLISRDNF
jgi:hypothetical protein